MHHGVVRPNAHSALFHMLVVNSVSEIRKELLTTSSFFIKSTTLGYLPLSVTASRKTLLAVLSLLGASIGIAAIAPNPILAAVLLAVAETTGQAGGAITWATAADIAPQGMAAQTGGIQNLASGLGGVTAPVVTGFLLAATGSFYWPLLIAGFIMIASAASYVFLLGKVEPVDLKYISAASSNGYSKTI